MTHRYVGPTTPWGLPHGAPVRLLGKRAGGRHVKTADGRRWLVAAAHLEPLR